MKWSGITTCLLLASCAVGPSIPRGLLTVQGKGSEALTNDGDPLLNTGVDARKVPIEFAKGYTKGVSDQVKRTYWARQEAQKTADEDLEDAFTTTTLPSRSAKTQTELSGFKEKSSSR